MGAEARDNNGENLERAVIGALAFLPLAGCSFFLTTAQASAPVLVQALLYTCAFSVASFAYDVFKTILVIENANVRPLLRSLLETHIYVFVYLLLVAALALIQLKVEITSVYLPWVVVALTILFMWLATRSFVNTVMKFSGQ